MDQILQMILEIVREQQRDASDLRDTMTKAEVVELTMSMMEQQGVEEYHDDLEADIYHRIQYLAPRLFEHEDAPNEPEIPMEKFSYRIEPTEEALLKNENLNLDHMVGDKLQGLDSPITIDTVALDYEQAYTHEGPIAFSDLTPSSVEQEASESEREFTNLEQISSQESPKFESVSSDANQKSSKSEQISSESEFQNLNSLENMDNSKSLDNSKTMDLSESMSEHISSMNSQLNEAFQDVLGESPLNQTSIDEETLNRLVIEKYMELSNSNSDNSQIDSASLASLVMQALQDTPMGLETESRLKNENMIENDADDENVDNLLKAIWESDIHPEESNERENFQEIETHLEERKQQDIIIHSDEEKQQKARTYSDEERQQKAGTYSDEERQQKAGTYLAEEKQAETKIYTERETYTAQTKKREKNINNKQNSTSSFHILSSFYNTKTYMEGFANYLKSFQENHPILTGFSSIDRILETGLHSGLYLINSDCIDISSFCLQLADQIATEKFPVCYFLFHHSRYEYMAKSLSRLTYELRGKEKAYTLSSLYQRQEETGVDSIQTELKYYEDKIAPNLYFVETNYEENSTLLSDINQAVQTIEQTVGRKPVILLEDIFLGREGENLTSRLEVLYSLENLCDDLGIILILSTNRLIESEKADKCSHIQIKLTELPEQDSFTKREIILETGGTLLLDVNFIDGFSRQEKKCQLFSIPKFYCFESR